jgi:Na+/H+ antiporter NhaD/arsenite permease-like protein
MIGLGLAAYVVAAAFGLPQRFAADGTRSVPAAIERPPYSAAIPFVALLTAIAVLPLLPATRHWWENNLHRFLVAAGLAAVTLGYYLLASGTPLSAPAPAAHAAARAVGGLHAARTGEVLGEAVLGEYVPFICLLFALYTISGGIRIEGDLPAHPLTNCTILAAGGVLASLIGTTGAAMLLIRFLLETNRERKQVRHTVVFFIFIVCNCGGCLSPVGDPPLLLGYLRGVPFLWTLGLWKEWLVVNAALLAIYYVWDSFWCYRREAPGDVARDERRVHRVRVAGVWPNALLLGGVVLSAALLDPGRAVPGIGWRPWVFLREAVELGLVVLSLLPGHSGARRTNGFHYGPMVEVAVLFFGIFVCMQPPLEILRVEGPKLGLSEPRQFFWASGGLSSILDNAPTYVVFFETAKSVSEQEGLGPTVAGVAERLLAAISLGSVFLGAMTYIGNGPNFMVKAVAERFGVEMPGFFGYLLYSAAVLLPLFVLTTWLF